MTQPPALPDLAISSSASRWPRTEITRGAERVFPRQGRVPRFCCGGGKKRSRNWDQNAVCASVIVSDMSSMQLSVLCCASLAIDFSWIDRHSWNSLVHPMSGAARRGYNDSTILPDKAAKIVTCQNPDTKDFLGSRTWQSYDEFTVTKQPTYSLSINTIKHRRMVWV